MKKLHKSKDSMICGVCSGIAEYLNVDPTIIRALWLLAVFGCGVGVLAYFVLALIMPEE